MHAVSGKSLLTPTIRSWLPLLSFIFTLSSAPPCSLKPFLLLTLQLFTPRPGTPECFCWAPEVSRDPQILLPLGKVKMAANMWLSLYSEALKRNINICSSRIPSAGLSPVMPGTRQVWGICPSEIQLPHDESKTRHGTITGSAACSVWVYEQIQQTRQFKWALLYKAHKLHLLGVPISVQTPPGTLSEYYF